VYAKQEEERRTYELHRLDLQGQSDEALTSDGNWNDSPTWSPTGKEIAFISRRGDLGDLYVIEADGSNVRRLTETPEQEQNPVWSPDGSRIAYLSGAAAGGGVVLAGADGSEPKLIASGRHTYAWSPDGSRIALADESGQRIFVYELSTGEETELGPGSGVSWSR
jgi:TolB protein